VVFSMLFGAAVYYRKRPSAHKSLMLLTAINAQWLTSFV
jgi:hypothetical protein